MKQVLLDTNFLLIPFQFGVDIYSEIGRLIDEKTEIFTLDLCINELKDVAPKNAKAAMALMKLKKVRIVRAKMHINVDETVFETAKKYNAVVCTQDAVLRTKCKKNGIDTIMMREKSHLSHG